MVILISRGVDGDEFPKKEESGDGTHTITIPVKELSEGINYTLFAGMKRFVA